MPPRKTQIDDPIAQRTIDVVDAEGRVTGSMTVLLGRPMQEPTNEWGCPFQIIGDGSDRCYWSFGLDAIQAIQGALLVIGGTLAGTEAAREGRLRWAGDPDLGFPLPPLPPD
jgi:hypothetical protein